MKSLPLLLASLMLACAPAYAGFEIRPVDNSQSITLDGALDDAAWRSAAVFDQFYETQPGDATAPRVRTEVRLAHDERYLYIGLKAFDADMGLLRAPFTRRDKVTGDQDYLAVYIDPTGGKTAAQFVYVNPRGAFSDGIYTDTAQEDYAPDFDVDVATARFDGGWSAEVRIALSSLPYTRGMEAPWNLLVMRNMSRDQRYKILSGPVPRTSVCMLCFGKPIHGLADLPSGLKWTAMPQLVMRRGYEETAGQPRRHFRDHGLSLDLKLRPGSNTTIDATLNPDFSQIELDAPQLSGNTNFGLFYPEMRPFFLEGSDVLQMPFRAVSTRTISDPAWGLRYTRRDAGSDVTVLTARDAGGGLVQLPDAYFTNFALQDFKSQATVARANFRLPTFSVGGLVSDRTLEDGRGYNRVAGTDFSWQRNDGERLRGQVLLSATTAHADAQGQLQRGPSKTGHAAILEWMREDEDWGYFAATENISDDFRNDNGFFSQVGYRDLAVSLTRKFGSTGPMHVFNVYAQGYQKYDTGDNLITRDAHLGLYTLGPFDTTINLRLRPDNAVRVKRDGELFRTSTVWGAIEAIPGETLANVALVFELGDKVDVDASRLGRGGMVIASARVRPGDRIELEPAYSASWISDQGARIYTEQLAQLNAIYHLSARDTVRITAQRTQVRREPSFYPFPVPALQKSSLGSLVYHHAVRLGTGLYAGVTLAKGETPAHLPKHRQNEAFIKLSWQI